MKTALIGILLAAFAAMQHHPNDNDISSWWILAGIGLGMIIGRIMGSFSYSN